MFQMHDLIQDMGRKVANNTRLIFRGNAWECLQNQEESDKIEGLVLDLTQSKEKQINSRIFERLPKLRLLEICDAHAIKGYFENSFQELRCIYWNYCTWTRIPSTFRPQKLISINMPCNNFKMLWDDAMHFSSLKMINVEYSLNLKTTPNFGNSKSIERLYFRGCESLLKVHPSIRELTGLNVLDLRELPDSIIQLKELVYLKLGGCKKLRKLPEQIGNMEGLRIFRASFTAIEQLPDSFGGLGNLETLDLRYCKNLRSLPSSIWKLKLLQLLDLRWCSKLERLPNKLEKMQCLEELYASYTAIEEVPESIGLLSRLRVLSLSCCEKVEYLPSTVWNLASLTQLYLFQTDIGRIDLHAKDTKLVNLALTCNVILWLPMILSFCSLKQLVLSDGGESLSTTKPFSLSKLYNLQYLKLYDCFGSSFPELPLNIAHLLLCDHATLVHIPDLSGLKKLKSLEIYRYISLESLPPLPRHLQSLTVYDCTNLQHLSDMSMLKRLSDLQFGKLKSVGSERSFLQVIDIRKHFLPFYRVEVPKIAEWFSYKSTGRTVSFDIPTMSADNFLGLALSVISTSETGNYDFSMKADITNKTNGTTKSCLIPVYNGIIGGEVYYVVKCISGDEISIRSGDRIKILLRRQLYSLNGLVEVPIKEVKVEMFAAHVIRRTLSTPDFPSVLNNLII